MSKLFAVIYLNLALILAAVFSCSVPQRPPYILSDSPPIQRLEEEDNARCNLIKLNSQNPNTQENQLYWNCRLSYARYRLHSSNPNNPFSQEGLFDRKSLYQENLKNFSLPNGLMDQELASLVGKITAIIYDRQNSSLQLELQHLDQRDHYECVELGYDFKTADKQQIDDYFLCRERLIERNSNLAPFGKNEYLQFINRSYSLGYVLDRNVAIGKMNESQKKENYPECSSFSIYSEEFETCTVKHDKIAACTSEIAIKKNEMKRNASMICQRQAYERFGNEMLKEESKIKQEIARKNYLSDYQNRINFDGLGIDEATFSKTITKNGDETKPFDSYKQSSRPKESIFGQFAQRQSKNDEQDGIKKKTMAVIKKKLKKGKSEGLVGSIIAPKSAEQIDKKLDKSDDSKLIGSKDEEQILNSKNALYTRYEIAVLRQKYIASCQKLITVKIQRIEELMQKKCQSSF